MTTTLETLLPLQQCREATELFQRLRESNTLQFTRLQQRRQP